VVKKTLKKDDDNDSYGNEDDHHEDSSAKKTQNNFGSNMFASSRVAPTLDIFQSENIEINSVESLHPLRLRKSLTMD
jgi:hypothetical protein